MNDGQRDPAGWTPPPEADDDELELEAPDEAVEEFRRKAVIESVRPSIDLDALYREAERDRGGEILEEWVRNFRSRFRFRVKHLVVATAVMAIAISLAKLGLLLPAIAVVVLLSVAGLYMYLTLQDRKHAAEVDQKREEAYAERRKKLVAQAAGNAPPTSVTTSATSSAKGNASIPEPAPVEIEPEAVEPFRFQISGRQLILITTAAAIALGLLEFLGGAAATAYVLGLLALGGLVLFGFGAALPQIIGFSWWVTLALYVVFSLFAAIWTRVA